MKHGKNNLFKKSIFNRTVKTFRRPNIHLIKSNLNNMATIKKRDAVKKQLLKYMYININIEFSMNGDH